ncbi:DUF1275 domain-containing protein [Streptomyces sp. RLB3-6]|nr:DUF1275 domain-containing protein [Streptomyces sp. RLB3-6]
MPCARPSTVSGLIDAVNYLGPGHVFTANMTGNVVIIGFAAVGVPGVPGFSVLGSLVSLAAFLLGADRRRLQTVLRPCTSPC